MITKQEFNTIIEAFTFYDQYLNSHEYTYTYHNKNTNTHESFNILFRKDNFMHLCGIEYHHIDALGRKKQKIPAKKLYSDLKKKRVSLEQLFAKKDGSTQQKLLVLPAMQLLIQEGVRVTESGTFFHVKFDKAIRTGKNIIGLTCISSGSKYVPQSIINLTYGSKSQSKSFSSSHKVVKLVSRNIQTNNTIRLF